jgi:hypothetical protein
MKGFPARDLALLYDKGNLVPFLGSGMSVPACAKWEPMIASLELAAEITVGKGTDLSARAERAVQILQNQGKERFVRALKKQYMWILMLIFTAPMHSSSYLGPSSSRPITIPSF